MKNTNTDRRTITTGKLRKTIERPHLSHTSNEFDSNY